MYLDPDFDLYPSIYAAKAVLAYHHVHNKLEKKLAEVQKDKEAHDSTNKAAQNNVARSNQRQSSNNARPWQSSTYGGAGAHSRGGANAVRNKTINIVYSNVQQSDAFQRKGPSSKSEEKLSEQGHSEQSHEGMSNMDIAFSNLGIGKDESHLDNTVAMAIRSSDFEVASGGECEDPDDVAAQVSIYKN